VVGKTSNPAAGRKHKDSWEVTMRDPSLSAADDGRLVQDIISGKDTAFVELYERYERRIYYFALKRTSDPLDAEDVTQEVFLQVFRGLAKFEGRSTLLTWMFGIAHKQICRRYRSRRMAYVSFDTDEVNQLPSAETPADRATDFARILRNCVRVLDEKVPEQQREVFEQRYIKNRSTLEIAQNLGKSQQAIKISIFRARHTLMDYNRKAASVLSA